MSHVDLGVYRPNASELQWAWWRMRGKALVIGVCSVVSYLGLVLVAHGILLAFLLAGALVVSLIATSTCVMHDANHGSFAKSAKVNRVAAYTADLLGASSLLWKFKHNAVHHGNTNVEGVDTDIEQLPFARLSPAQPWKPWHRYQHIYMWALYGFLTVQWLVFSDFASLFTGKVGSQALRRTPRRRDVVKVVLGKAGHLAWAVGLPLLFHAWWVVIAFYFACSWLVGFFLAVFFQVAHCVDNVEFTDAHAARRGEDFADHQLRTTSDVACRTPLVGPVLASLMGGLHHQVEHHLAPALPHTAYAAMARRLRSSCAASSTRYNLHSSPWTALRSHARWLRTMGIAPSPPIPGRR
jgi:linoleoyl-CoA desaturase